MNESYLDPGRLHIVPSLILPESGVIIADARVKAIYGDYFPRSIPILELKAIERAKSLNTLGKIYGFLSEHNVHRSDIVHVVGGGLICDLAAYGVATFKRGCRLRLYPSTLLSMIDAAIGGKCAVNYRNIKNHIGTFYPAEEIFIHPNFLHTLSSDELRQGLAEMLKSYLISDQLSPLDLSCSIPPSSQILEYAVFKMQLCKSDPYDLGARQQLNFGHTFAHILESSSQYRFKHGDCVVAGMIIALNISLKQGLISKLSAQALLNTLRQYPLPAGISDFYGSLDYQDILRATSQDKKNSNKVTRMVLPVAFRRVEVQEVVLNSVVLSEGLG